MFFIIFTSVVLLGCLYVALRLIPRTSLRGYKRIMAYALCFFPLLTLPVRHYTRALSRAGEAVPAWLDLGLFISHILLGALSLVATVVFVYDIFLLSRWLYRKSTGSTPAVHSAERRAFLQNSVSTGIVAISGGLGAYGASEALFTPEVKHIRIPVTQLPDVFQGYRMAHITDLHINRPIPPSRLEKIVSVINGLQPDVVAITGDLSDSYPAQVQAEMAPLAMLKAPDGVYFVSGNHEYYTSIGLWLAEVSRLNITNLSNEHKVIERDGSRLLICGVPDFQMAPLSSPLLAQKGSHHKDIKILLAHQPQSIYEAAQAGYHVQLCGHTHGGQFFPWTMVVDHVQTYFQGLYTVGKTQLYVNRGTGYWGPPLRIGASPEIALIELVQA